MLRPVAVLASFLLTASQLFSQQHVSQQSPQRGIQPAPAVTGNRTSLQSQESAKLTARTDLVLVPVVVTDRSGKHVSGLKKEAFRIEENGSVRSVSVFEETKTEKLVARGRDVRREGYSNFVPGD